MYIVVNKDKKVLSKTNQWVDITQVKEIKVFEVYMTASQKRMKAGGEEIISCHILLLTLIERLEVLGPSLHTFLMGICDLQSLAEVGGEIEKANRVEELLAENRKVHKENKFLKSEIDRLQHMKEQFENMMAEFNK